MYIYVSIFEYINIWEFLFCSATESSIKHWTADRFLINPNFIQSWSKLYPNLIQTWSKLAPNLVQT